MSDLRAALEAALAEDFDDLAAHAAYADLLTEMGDPRGELIQVQLALEDVGCIGAGRAELERREEELLGAHEGLSGMPGSFMERSEYARCAAAARELLGEEGYLASHERGGRLTLREASALLNDPGPFGAADR